MVNLCSLYTLIVGVETGNLSYTELSFIETPDIYRV